MQQNTRRTVTKLPTRLLGTALLSLPMLLVGCHSDRTDAKPAALDTPDKGAAADDEGIALKPEEVAKMGIETTALVATKHAPETAGFGVVMSHDAIAQGVADLATAVAVERQSQAAFRRSKGLAGTAGAMPVDTLEAAERQATVDRAALELERRRLSSTYGQDPPWKDNEASQQLMSLASGRIKLIRVTFPLGTMVDVDPKELRFAHLSAAGGKTWKATSVWRAPADASVPGKSYFALLTGGDFGEGERVLAMAPLGDPEDGVIIPAGAAVITNGRYWYYIEAKPGVFVRTALDTSVADEGGYFVKQGASAGDKVVTSAAGQLLARDLNPSKEAN
jgi:hypothetical protein